MRPPAIVELVTLALSGSVLACGYDWDAVDPRLGAAGSAGVQGGGSGGVGGASGSAGSSGLAGSSGGAGVSGAAGAGSCVDQAKNGDETDEDCGGLTCPRCANGKTCKLPGDCETGECTGSVCGPPRNLYLWWVDSRLDRLSRAPANVAAAPQSIVDLGQSTSRYLRSLAVDTSLGKVYYSDSAAHHIRRANLDGSNDQVILPGLDQPMSLALDVAGNKLYWADQGTTAKIQRANLDGTSVQDLVVDPLVQHPYGLALDVAAGHVYFIDNDLDKLFRSNLDGSNLTDLMIPGLDRAIEIALNLEARKIYWTDLGDTSGATPNIRRANLDGTSVEPVLTRANFASLGSPFGIDVDVLAGQIYFVDGGTGGSGIIVRANLDGSGVVPLIVSLPEARGVKIVTQ